MRAEQREMKRSGRKDMKGQNGLGVPSQLTWKTIVDLKGPPVRFHVNWWEGIFPIHARDYFAKKKPKPSWKTAAFSEDNDG